MIRQCEECGRRGTDLHRCSRCKAVWYCNRTCQVKNWDLHKAQCQPNEIADRAEQMGDEKYAEWIRTKNRKVAMVIGTDGKIEYGKLPKNEKSDKSGDENTEKAPELSFAEKQESDYAKSLIVRPGFGLEESGYKWTQTTAIVVILIKLDENATSRTFDVVIKPKELSVTDIKTGATVLAGTLSKQIKAEESVWEFNSETKVLCITLLKLWRKGSYKSGETNAETWWKSLFDKSKEIDMKYPPTEYYSCDSF